MGYPLKEQVCAKEQAKELTELLGENAPESLWVWDKHPDTGWDLELSEDAYGVFLGMNPGYHAYTGDELGALIKNSAGWVTLPGYATPSDKAKILIDLLKNKAITPEEVKYE